MYDATYDCLKFPFTFFFLVAFMFAFIVFNRCTGGNSEDTLASESDCDIYFY